MITEPNNDGLLQSGTPILLKNWMSNVNDKTHLSTIAIPGTHDSEADNLMGNNGIGSTQDWPLLKQLNNGIRFIDIRIRNGEFNIEPSLDNFVVAHGPIAVGDFNSVMTDLKTFLEKNNSETILMSIKHEKHGVGYLFEALGLNEPIRSDNDELDTNRLIYNYIHATDNLFFQQPVTTKTTIGELRGKIVLVDRIGLKQNIGINWNGNNGDNVIKGENIQDDYNLSAFLISTKAA